MSVKYKNYKKNLRTSIIIIDPANINSSPIVTQIIPNSRKTLKTHKNPTPRLSDPTINNQTAQIFVLLIKIENFIFRSAFRAYHLVTLDIF